MHERRPDRIDAAMLRLVCAVHDHLQTLERSLMTTQADIDTVTADLNAYKDTVLAELDALETQIVAGTPAPALDLTGLKAAVAALPVAPDNTPAAPSTNGALPAPPVADVPPVTVPAVVDPTVPVPADPATPAA